LGCASVGGAPGRPFAGDRPGGFSPDAAGGRLDSRLFPPAPRPAHPDPLRRGAPLQRCCLLLALATCWRWFAAGLARPAAAPAAAAPAQGAALAFPIAETGFDPAQISDLYSRTRGGRHLRRAAGPTTTWRGRRAQAQHRRGDARGLAPTSRASPSASGPASSSPTTRPSGPEARADGGRLRLQHQAPLRPALEEPNLFHSRTPDPGPVGAAQAGARREKKPFDYDTEVEGLRALDRYTFEIRLAARRRAALQLCRRRPCRRAGARGGRAYGDKIGEHPVGTGPFRLAPGRAARASCWSATRTTARCSTTSSRRPTTPRLQAMRAQLQGPPAADARPRGDLHHRGAQPRWLSLPEREIDMLSGAGNEFANIADPQQRAGAQPGQARHHGALPARRRGISYFGMENPVVGGYEPHKVALRRAIALASTTRARDPPGAPRPGMPAQPICRRWHHLGLRPPLQVRDERHDLPRAKALLDLYGYVDRDGDGWREQPDGSRWCWSTPPSPTSRAASSGAVAEEHGRHRHPHRVQASPSGPRT
jgi:hypothetical protein